ncbi:MAG: restriction endonuclease subunit S [Gemmatimonadaceae bacterium]|nr:restriction endonuclease subunit S [Gemmatimonadaceae bacterium]
MTGHLEWTQHLPSGWHVKPLRAVSSYVVSNVDKIPVDSEPAVRLCNYSDVYNNEFIAQHLDFMACTATEDEIRKFGLQVNDVIITKDSESWDDIGIPTLVVETADDLVCGYHLALLRPHATALSGRFLFRCLQAKVLRLQLELAANGVTRFGLPKSDIGAMRLPVPPLEHQLGIADFLDQETARLDALVAAKQRVLDLLAEKRKAIIATAVTRGLDPKVKLRDSGVPWLGEIPSHWELRRAKYLFRQSDLPVATGDEIVTCFRDGQVTLRRNRREEGFTNADLEVGYQGIRTGQLVLHSMDAFAGAIGVSDSDGRCSPEYIICDPLDTSVIVPEYFGPLLRTMALAGFIQASCPAVRERAPRIRFNNFGEMHLPAPPLDEQRSIVTHIARETAKLDAVRAATDRTVSLLKDRRSALIAAAVTGQLDVGAAA